VKVALGDRKRENQPIFKVTEAAKYLGFTGYIPMIKKLSDLVISQDKLAQ
jgi:hypothetical protein